jgi:cytochrome oxidase Cu insertion factor (SCO1/SenC/PrrC family)
VIGMRKQFKRAAKPIYILLSLIMAFGVGAGIWQINGQPPEAAQTVTKTQGPAPHAPDFTLTYLNGTRITLSSLGGKPVLLNFWAST